MCLYRRISEVMQKSLHRGTYFSGSQYPSPSLVPRTALSISSSCVISPLGDFAIHSFSAQGSSRSPNQSGFCCVFSPSFVGTKPSTIPPSVKSRMLLGIGSIFPSSHMIAGAPPTARPAGWQKSEPPCRFYRGMRQLCLN